MAGNERREARAGRHRKDSTACRVGSRRQHDARPLVQRHRAVPYVLAALPTALMVGLIVAATAQSAAGGVAEVASTSEWPSTAVVQQLERGAEVYAFSCTTCHGATGQGFAEARAAFPADHYDCVRCHGPLNPPQMTTRQIQQSQSVFSLGIAPPLADADALARFGNAAALYGYVRATMPRWDPGRLDDDAYVDVTAFVLELAGLHPGDRRLTPETLPQVTLEAEPQAP
jgi:mono/diheme cytochrome c family protein